MACPQYESAIQDLIDGSLGPLRRAELELHLDQCEECRALARDLQRVRDAAAALDPVPVPERVWSGLAAKLQGEGYRAPAARHRGYGLLAIAASLIIFVGLSLWLLRSSSRSPELDTMAATPPATAPATAGNASARGSVQGVSDAAAGIEEEFRLAEQHYQNAIARLEEAARSDSQAIDPQTAALLQKNLALLDQAIAESRSALRAEPLSVPARETLFTALRRKVALLQDTIALMNEMRKGNAAGVARIVDQG